MKKLIVSLVIVLTIFTACGKNKDILDTVDFVSFVATIEEIGNNSSLLVRTTDENVGFEYARVGYDRDLEFDFIFNIGDQVRLTILPEIRESYPVQVTAIKVEKLD